MNPSGPCFVSVCSMDRKALIRAFSLPGSTRTSLRLKEYQCKGFGPPSHPVGHRLSTKPVAFVALAFSASMCHSSITAEFCPAIDCEASCVSACAICFVKCCVQHWKARLPPRDWKLPASGLFQLWLMRSAFNRGQRDPVDQILIGGFSWRAGST